MNDDDHIRKLLGLSRDALDGLRFTKAYDWRDDVEACRVAQAGFLAVTGFLGPDVGRLAREQVSDFANLRVSGPKSFYRDAVKDLVDHERLIRAAGIETYGTSAIDEATSLRDVGLIAGSAISPFDAQFGSARHADVATLLGNSARHLLDDDNDFFVRGYSESIVSLAARMAETVRSPWVRHTAPDHSADAVLRLCAIGDALTHQHPFADEMVAALRDDLGDWRGVSDTDVEPEPAAAPAATVARVRRYIDRGLDTSLTDFPDAAFDEIMIVADFRQPLMRSGGDGKALQRVMFATRDLHQFEHAFRSFIEMRMTAVAGPNWAKHRLPGAMHNEWQHKSEQRAKQGAPYPRLVDAAEFTDYPKIITREDNWRDAFKPLFFRKEAVTECFNRLNPTRKLIAHSNTELLANEDVFLFRVDLWRLYRTIESGAA